MDTSVERRTKKNEFVNKYFVIKWNDSINIRNECDLFDSFYNYLLPCIANILHWWVIVKSPSGGVSRKADSTAGMDAWVIVRGLIGWRMGSFEFEMARIDAVDGNEVEKDLVGFWRVWSIKRRHDISKGIEQITLIIITLSPSVIFTVSRNTRTHARKMLGKKFSNVLYSIKVKIWINWILIYAVRTNEDRRDNLCIYTQIF